MQPPRTTVLWNHDLKNALKTAKYRMTHELHPQDSCYTRACIQLRCKVMTHMCDVKVDLPDFCGDMVETNPHGRDAGNYVAVMRNPNRPLHKVSAYCHIWG